MKTFLTVGKYATVAAWILPLLALCGFFSGQWNFYVLWIAVAVFMLILENCSLSRAS